MLHACTHRTHACTHSHGLTVGPLPPPLPPQGSIVAIENPAKNIFGFQFHPEVMHTEGGMDMIKHFLMDIAGVKPDWTMGQVIENQMRIIAEKVRPPRPTGW